MSDKKSLAFDGECCIIYSKWCDSMENYMSEKYEKQVNMSMKHSISIHDLMKNQYSS